MRSSDSQSASMRFSRWGTFGSNAAGGLGKSGSFILHLSFSRRLSIIQLCVNEIIASQDAAAKEVSKCKKSFQQLVACEVMTASARMSYRSRRGKSPKCRGPHNQIRNRNRCEFERFFRETLPATGLELKVTLPD